MRTVYFIFLTDFRENLDSFAKTQVSKSSRSWTREIYSSANHEAELTQWQESEIRPKVPVNFVHKAHNGQN